MYRNLYLLPTERKNRRNAEIEENEKEKETSSKK